VVRITPWPLNSRDKSPGTRWIEGWADPRAVLDTVTKKHPIIAHTES